MPSPYMSVASSAGIGNRALFSAAASGPRLARLARRSAASASSTRVPAVGILLGVADSNTSSIRQAIMAVGTARIAARSGCGSRACSTISTSGSVYLPCTAPRPLPGPARQLLLLKPARLLSTFSRNTSNSTSFISCPPRQAHAPAACESRRLTRSGTLFPTDPSPRPRHNSRSYQSHQIRSFSASIPCTVASSPFSSSSSPSSASTMGSTIRTNDASSPYKVLVLGGAYSGMAAALNLTDLCAGKPSRGGPHYGLAENKSQPIHVDVTVVDERDGFYHLIGSPLVFASNDYAKTIWVPYKEVPAIAKASNIHFIQGSATDVDLASKKATIEKVHGAGQVSLDYDFVVVATGLRRVFPVVPQSLDKEDYLKEAAAHVEKVASAKDGVLVVGGGAVGIEMACELKMAQPNIKVTLAHSRSQLLSSEKLDDCVAIRTLEIMKEQNIEVLLEHRLKETKRIDETTEEVVFTNGHTLKANVVVMAISKSVPSTSFLPKEALDEEGLIKIQPTLFFPETVPNHESALGAGDVCSWSGIKRCGGAMYRGHHAAFNIHQLMQKDLFGTTPAFQKLEPVPPMIAIALGESSVAYKNGDEAVQSGSDVVQNFFQDDLGFKICWNFLGLGTNPDTTEEKI